MTIVTKRIVDNKSNKYLILVSLTDLIIKIFHLDQYIVNILLDK